MDINYINSNEEKVRCLHNVVIYTAEHVETESIEMLDYLKKFRNHIDEDGYNKIFTYISKNIKALDNAKPALKHYADTLLKMADKLKELKKGLTSSGNTNVTTSQASSPSDSRNSFTVNKKMSKDDVNNYYISGLESIDEQISAYREALVSRGVTDEEWLSKTLIHHSELMKKQLTNDLETSQGKAVHEDIYQYPADMKNFYDCLYNQYIDEKNKG